MARTITINMTSGPPCFQYYSVEYGVTGQGYGAAIQYYEAPIVIYNLFDNTSYDFRITTVCCNGASSTPDTFTLNTTPLDPPDNFLANQDGADVDLTWDTVAEADEYELQRATNAGFTTGLTELYTGATNSYTDLSPGAGTFYYRVRSLATGYGDSAWVSLSITLV